MSSWVKFSLKHPVPTIVLFLTLVVIGAVSVTRLSVDLYPAMEYPLAVISTKYEGAGPQEVEQLVSRPLEEIAGTAGGVTSVMSTNSEGQSVVLVQFDWGTDMDLATLSLREKVDQVKGFFPDGVGAPMVFKIDPQALPVLTIGLSGADPIELKRLAEEKVKPRLERTDGVASVNINGGTEREIQVIVDPHRLQASGISINQVAQALRYENLNLPGGQVESGTTNLLVRTVGQFSSVDEIRELRLGPVRLGDIAEVRDAYAEVTSKVWIDGEPAVGMDIQKQTGGNTVAIAEGIKAELDLIAKDLPAGVKASVLMDQSKMVQESVMSVADSGWQGGLLAIAVLYIFLRHFGATLAVGIAIPISVIATFGPLFFGGVTLNLMSLGGLSLGVGMMVDGAIVVLENIFRHKQMGKDIDTATLDGASEVGLAVSSSTITTVVVFLPVVWITGIAQQYFRELALSVTYSLMTSLLVSITLVPMLARYLLRDKTGPVKPPSRLYVWWGEKLDAIDAVYRRMLGWALRHRWTVLTVGTLSLGLTALFYFQLGMEFIPKTDTSEFRITVRMPPGTQLSETEKAVNKAVEAARQVPELRQMYVSLGSTGDAFSVSGGKSNVGYVVGALLAPGERERDLETIMESLRQSITIPGARVNVVASGMLDPGGSPIEVQIRGDDLSVLEALANQAADVIAKVPGAREVRTSVDEGLPEVQVKVDRARAAAYNLSPSTIAVAVQSAVKGQVVSEYRSGGKEIDIRLQATEAARADMEALAQLPISSGTGQTVPLGQIATLVKGTGPTVVEREDRARVVKITGSIHDRDMGHVVSDIKAEMAKVAIPPGYTVSYEGQNKEMEDAFGGLIQALLFSIALVYLTMAAQFESWLHPFIIMFTVPLSLSGAFGSLVLTGRSLDISGMIGLILLVGIVVDNAIVLIDHVNQLRREGHSVMEALQEGCPTRLRPVLMTTLCTLLGLFPLALGLAAGSDLQAPMATVVIGGLAVSTLLTLIMIPVVYSLVEDLVARILRRSPAKAA
ncbi:MAG: AcrB family rane transport protein [Symbiobacteriaceae bacterium]|jgi:HAE1 family hydrophobic/amphiphilic exporter-1|nr:AcrB family rane transport protein [Symbiobacteriaceae bacterium]